MGLSRLQRHRFEHRPAGPVIALLTAAMVVGPVAVGSAATPFSGARVRFETGPDSRVLSAHRLMLGPYAGADLDPRLVVSPFLAEHGALFGFRTGMELIPSAARVGPTWVVRLTQVVAGVPVVGRGLVLKVDEAGRVRSVAGVLTDLSTVDTMPSIAPSRAVSAALAVLESAGEVGAVADAPLLTVVVGAGERPVLVWHLATTGPAGSRTHWVDAHSGAVLLSRDARFYVLGRWYDPNPAVSPLPATGELAPLDPPGDTLSGAYADVFACGTLVGGNCSLTRNAVPDMAGDYLYDPPVPEGGVFDDPFAEVHAYHHISAFAAWWEDELDYLPWPYLTPLQTIVNFNDGSNKEGDPESFGNAFFDPVDELIGFGQTATRDFSYDADVVYHELTHAVVGDSLAPVVFDDLGLDVSGFGLNEGTADAFATLYTGDPHLGEYVGGADGLRDMTNDHTCPDSLIGEPHEDGKIWGGAAWDAREHLESVLGPGEGSLAMALLLSRALQAIVPTAGYAGFTAELLDQAELDPVYAAIAPDLEAIYSARGLVGCERIISLDDGNPHAGNIYGRGIFFGQAPNLIPGPVQYRIFVPEAAALQVGLFVLAANGPTIYIRKDAPVTWSGFGASLRALEHDYEFPQSISAEIGPGSDPPIGPGYYYISVGNSDFNSMFYALQATLLPVELPAPPPADAGAAGDAGVADELPAFGVGGGRGGCALSSHAGTTDAAAWAWLAAMVVGFVVVRGRRRGSAG